MLVLVFFFFLLWIAFWLTSPRPPRVNHLFPAWGCFLLKVSVLAVEFLSLSLDIFFLRYFPSPSFVNVNITFPIYLYHIQ